MRRVWAMVVVLLAPAGCDCAASHARTDSGVAESRAEIDSGGVGESRVDAGPLVEVPLCEGDAPALCRPDLDDEILSPLGFAPVFGRLDGSRLRLYSKGCCGYLGNASSAHADYWPSGRIELLDVDPRIEWLCQGIPHGDGFLTIRCVDGFISADNVDANGTISNYREVRCGAAGCCDQLLQVGDAQHACTGSQHSFIHPDSVVLADPIAVGRAIWDAGYTVARAGGHGRVGHIVNTRDGTRSLLLAERDRVIESPLDLEGRGAVLFATEDGWTALTVRQQPGATELVALQTDPEGRVTVSSHVSGRIPIPGLRLAEAEPAVGDSDVLLLARGPEGTVLVSVGLDGTLGHFTESGGGDLILRDGCGFAVVWSWCCDADSPESLRIQFGRCR